MGERTKFSYIGKVYYSNAPVISKEELSSIVGADWDPRSRVISTRPEGTYVVDKDIDLVRHSNLDKIPNGTEKGVYDRTTCIKAQVASVSEVFGPRYGMPIQLDRNLEFLFIPRYPMPRKWGGRETSLLIRFPPQYPQKPPEGFFLSKTCGGSHIFSRNVHDHSQDYSSKGWNWYCVHCDVGWAPGPHPLDTDNLWTFLKVIRASLTINEF
jgi:hypothetical protein